MREFIPGLGDRTARDRLDELFNRQTLGSVVFGGHLNKVFEKVYNTVALVIVLHVLGVPVQRAILIAVALLVFWLVGLVVVVYVFVKWEHVVAAAETAKEEYVDEE